LQHHDGTWDWDWDWDSSSLLGDRDLIGQIYYTLHKVQLIGANAQQVSQDYCAPSTALPSLINHAPTCSGSDLKTGSGRQLHKSQRGRELKRGERERKERSKDS